MKYLFFHCIAGVLSLERGTYDVIENEGTVEMCAVLTGGVLSTDTQITLQARDNTARFKSEYLILIFIALCVL